MVYPQSHIKLLESHSYTLGKIQGKKSECFCTQRCDSDSSLQSTVLLHFPFLYKGMWQCRAEIWELCPAHSGCKGKDEHRSLQGGEQRAKWAQIRGKILFRALQEAWEQGLEVLREGGEHGLKEKNNLIKTFKKSGCRIRAWGAQRNLWY